VLAGRLGQPLQLLLEVHGRPLPSVAGQLQVVHHRVDDLQAAAVLVRGRHGLAAEGDPIGPLTVGSVTGVHDLDDALPVPDAYLDPVLLARAGVLDDVSAGLAERQRDVSPRIRPDPQGLQAPVEHLAADRHAGDIAGQMKHQVDFHVIHLRSGTSTPAGR